MTILTASAGRRRVAAPPVQYPTSAPYNVPTHLTTPTYDGSGETVHLDVIDFGPGGWKGLNKRFAMVHTPYPNYNADWEDPSLLISDDGINWATPAGLTNPLYSPTGAYNNDPDMALDPATDELVLSWRDYDQWRIARSADGINWPAEPTALGRIAVSPAILCDSSGVWHRWTQTHHSTAMAPEGPYGGGGTNTGLISPWHLNVAEAPGGGFHMIYHDNVAKDVKVASSADGHTWATNPTPVLVSGTHAWSQADLYRPAFVIHEDGDRYRVWYSGVGVNPENSFRSAWRVGYTEIPLSEWPDPPV